MATASIIKVRQNMIATIEGTRRSVRDQTYSTIEYVVIDGASLDNPLDIIAVRTLFGATANGMDPSHFKTAS